MTLLLRNLEEENRNKSEEGLTKSLYIEESYVKELIHATMPNLEIHVERVNNNFLEALYLLTKAEYESRYSSCSELILMHVTEQDKVKSIISDNLNWRKSVGGIYGKGTYFSDNARLANQICNRDNGNDRAIIVCKVLINRSAAATTSNPEKVPSFVDTITAYGDQVFIKFCDNEFLPLFVASYVYEDQNCFDEC